jgi:hypothetical protein
MASQPVPSWEWGAYPPGWIASSWLPDGPRTDLKLLGDSWKRLRDGMRTVAGQAENLSYVNLFWFEGSLETFPERNATALDAGAMLVPA